MAVIRGASRNVLRDPKSANDRHEQIGDLALRVNREVSRHFGHDARCHFRVECGPEGVQRFRWRNVCSTALRDT